MLVAAAAMTFFACQKQEMNAPEVVEVNGLAFSSVKPSFDDETKTEWTGESIQWSKGDKIRVAYTCDGVWQNADGSASADEIDGQKTAKFYPSVELAEDAERAQFNVPGKFEGNSEGEYVFYGVYPSAVVGSSDIKNAPSFNVMIPSVQTPHTDSFDPQSDVMVAQSDDYEGIPSETISLMWNRKVAHANITLKEIKGITDDEKVLSIKITAQEGANMVGLQTYNFETGELEQHSDNTEANTLELNGANLSIVNGNIVFWASFVPCTLENFTVEVNTDAATYTRVVEVSSPLVFKQNARNLLAVKMHEAERTDRVSEITATLSFDDKAKRTEYTSSVQVWSDNGITLTNNKASSTTAVADYAKPARFYQNSSIVLEAEGNITKIVFDCNTNDYASAVKTSIGTTATTSVSSDKVTVTFSSPVESFTIAKLSAQVRMDAVNVTYTTAGGSETPDLTPVFTVSEKTLQLDANETAGSIKVDVKNLYDIEANSFSDQECTDDCNWLAAEWTSEGIAYTVAENTSNDLRKAYIQITALDKDNVEYSEVITISQATSFIEELTVEEFLAKEVHPYMWYQLTGVMSNIVDTKFGNFDLTDGTGKVYVYGLKKNMTAANTTFAELGLRVNDEVTLVGNRAVYNSKAQVGNAYYVKHVAAPYLEVTPTNINVGATDTEASFTVDSNVDWNIESEDVNDWEIAQDGNVTVYFSENTTAEIVNYEVTVKSEVKDVVVTINQAKKTDEVEADPVTIIIDGSTLTSTASTADSNHTFGGVTVTMSKGAKYQVSSKATNSFSKNASILIGKSGAYIYNSTPIPGRITKFEIYANEGASAKVSVGVNFSSNIISKYNASAPNTYTATLSTLNAVYDCSDKLPLDAQYFWYQVTNANNSQVQFRITYIPEN